MKKTSYAGAIIFILLLTVFAYCLGFEEIETYTFHATITNMEILSHPRASNPQYRNQHCIYWADGMLAGACDVSAQTYAKYTEGDLIEITGVIEQDWFGNIYENFVIRD